jgi:flagellar basal body-associated protein FliL
MSNLTVSPSNVQGQNELTKRDSQTMSPKSIWGIVVVVLAVLGAGAALVLSVGFAMILAGVVVGVVALVMGVVGAALLISERVKTREPLGSSEAPAQLTQQPAAPAPSTQQSAAPAPAPAPAPAKKPLNPQGKMGITDAEIMKERID